MALTIQNIQPSYEKILLCAIKKHSFIYKFDTDIFKYWPMKKYEINIIKIYQWLEYVVE
jgi:hypothetical protein